MLTMSSRPIHLHFVQLSSDVRWCVSEQIGGYNCVLVVKRISSTFICDLISCVSAVFAINCIH